MAEHENNIGETDEWYTPQWMIEALGDNFDLDPCSPGKDHWISTNKIYTKKDDGLSKEWKGYVFMNPPFGGRNKHTIWMEKLIKHGNGIGVVRAYTSSAWFHELIPQTDAILFPKGKTKFIRPDGSIGKAPGAGVVLFAMGERAMNALKKSGLGIYYKNKH